MAKVGAAAPGEGVLANFFNSLLSKKSNAQVGGKSSVRQDASAELEKMTRTKKLSSMDNNAHSGSESS